MSPPLNARTLEARTQAIGRELFAAAKREHASLSALNRWTSQVLSWCLSDPAVKANLLRFIDVLPSLDSPRDIVRHVREYFPPGFRLPAALRFGVSLARPAMVTQGALAALIRNLVQQLAGQFIAEATPEGARRVVEALAARGATCSLDLLGEQVLSVAEAEQYVAACGQLVRQSQAAYAALASPPRRCGPLVNLSVKPSALTPRFDPISPSHSVTEAAEKLMPLLRVAVEEGALLNLDMEQYELRDLTLALAKQLLAACPQDRPALGVVIQAYLTDAEAAVEELLAWLAAHERRLTVRVVKGAYWDAEVAQAAQSHWPAPVHQRKTETDAAFERLTERLLQAHPLVTTAVASHNVRSIAHAMATAELLGQPKEQLEFQLLYGMGDALHGAIVERGYPVRIYTPVGALIPGMAYLVRRILENTANESFLRQDFLHERGADELLQPPVASGEIAGPSEPAGEWRGEPLVDWSKAAQRERMAEALRAVRARLGGHEPLLLGGRWIDTAERLTSRNPAHPEEIIGTVARAHRDQVEEAVQHARRAQPGWAALPVQERVACLRRAAEEMRRQQMELAALAVLEAGKTWREADVEIIEAVDYLDYYSEQMQRLAEGRRLPQPPGERNFYQYRPLGVAAVIAPWNFPAAILMGMTSAALVGGNAAIVKPSEQSAVIALRLIRILADAGVPAGVLQCVPGRGEDVGAALVQHAGTQAILFTGSKAVGLSIIEACGRVAPGQRFLKRAIIEMGGKNAIIVDADADLDAAIQGIVRSAFGYGGQKCSAASRVIVHRAVYERLLPRLIAAVDRLVVGDPADPATDLGPLIEASAQQRLLEAVAHAERMATVAYRSPASRMPSTGHYAPPVIVTDVPAEDRLAREELFGPLLCVARADTLEAAITLANDTDYALTGGIYSRSPAHISRAMEACDVGNFYVNRPITGAMVGRQPFGGHRLSGLGTKAGGPDYLLHLLLPKTISINTARHGMPLE